MADNDIIQGMIARPGQSQQERTAPELDIHYADVDERTTAELISLAGKLARRVNHFRDSLDAPSGDWSPFFPEDATAIGTLLAGNDGATSPHLALFISFLRMYQLPQELINRITGRHLDFYYQEVLRLGKRPAEPDRAHLLMELKKQAEPTAIGPEHRFTAGRDSSGVELLYAPAGTTVINHARVAALATLYVAGDGTGPVYAATPAPGAAWRPFGEAGAEPAEVGFALSSPALIMREGERKVTVTFTFSGNGPKDFLASRFTVKVTGEKGWIAATAAHGTDPGSIVVTVSAGAGAITGFGPVHGDYRFSHGIPVVLFILSQKSGTPYGDLKGLQVASVSLTAGASGITPDSLESDAGRLDPKKSFLPFGPLPTRGSRFMIGCREALGKKLARLDLTLQWKNLPDLSATYRDYGITDVTGTFTAAACFKAGGAGCRSDELPLFQEKPAERAYHGKEKPHKSPLIINDGALLNLLPTDRATTVDTIDGFVTLFLNEGFHHDDYRQQYVAELARFARLGGDLKLPPEPYTPTVQSISLAYETDVYETSFGGKGSGDVTVYHLDCFGCAPLSSRNPVPLLPQHHAQGELLIGLSSLNPGDSVSILFQVLEGSGAAATTRGDIAWSTLSGNRWQSLERSAITRDTTNGLRRSGIMTFAIPPGTVLDNTLMAPGLAWLKGELADGTAAADLLLAVAANAVEVCWLPVAGASAHLATALPAGSITKLKTGIPPVKSISQPFPSFGGRTEENAARFHTRVAERLRHKNRCISIWDWERMVLEAFPKIHRVKCIPHARKGNFLAPGNVLVVVIPDQRNRSGVELLQPRADADTLTAISSFVADHAGMGLSVEVQNPVYREVTLEFAVQFRRPDFNYHRKLLNEALLRFLSPWAFDSSREMTFGGTIYKSVLVDFVEELDYVEFVTDFRMTSGGAADLDQVRPESPDAILVSAESHLISPVTGGAS